MIILELCQKLQMSWLVVNKLVDHLILAILVVIVKIFTKKAAKGISFRAGWKYVKVFL